MSVLYRIQNDCAEWATSCGMPTWGGLNYPCPLTFGSRADWLPLEDVTDEDWGWSETKHEDYMAARRLCEVHVVVRDRPTHVRLLSALDYDKR